MMKITAIVAAAIGSLFFPATAFSFDVLHSFSGPEGETPAAPLMQAADGLLYGVAAHGGDFSVLPPDGAGSAMRRLFDIAERGGALPSAAARMMGTQAGGMLSLARPGVELTLDLPAAATLPELMHRLEREILDREGRVALASDAYLTDHGFAAMYPRLEAFRAVLAHIDPDMRLQSDLARRLRLRDYVV